MIYLIGLVDGQQSYNKQKKKKDVMVPFHWSMSRKLVISEKEILLGKKVFILPKVRIFA